MLTLEMFWSNITLAGSANPAVLDNRIPIIDITDLYHPYQGPWR